MRWLSQILADAHVAARRLAKSPATTLTAAGTLAQVAPTDPGAIGAAAAAVAVAAMLASIVPARRAARVDPAVALRQE
jgi:hypothetical protein